jgi:UDP-N-acetylmuramate--alanine ligase
MIHHKKAAYYIVGIKGAAMVHIAVILKKMGHAVSGADSTETFPTDHILVDNDISFEPLETAELPENTTTVLYSAAHGGSDSRLVQEAVSQGIPAMHQAEFIGALLKEFRTTIGVAGCHGKTTTASFLAYALQNLNQHPSYLVGTPTFSGMPGGNYQKKEYFVFEADEYGVNPPHDRTSKLSYFHPSHAIITNIDFDHPDVFTSLEEVVAVFSGYISSVEHVVYCCDNEPLRKLVAGLDKKNTVSYGFSPEAEYQIRHMAFFSHGSSFALAREGENIARFKVSLFGEKSISNAAGVVVMLLTLGFTVQQIADVLPAFTGAKRRFELIAEQNGVSIFDDYAHHPRELEALISAARKRFPERPVKILFQPHTYSRTERFKEAFIDVLAEADAAVIAPIFASAREQQSEITISAESLREIISSKMVKTVHAAETMEEFLEMLNSVVEKNDIVITAGAGDIYKITDNIIDIIKKK